MSLVCEGWSVGEETGLDRDSPAVTKWDPGRFGGVLGLPAIKLADPRDANSLSGRFRARRNILLRAFLLAERTRRRRAKLRVIDIGGTGYYWRLVGLDFLADNEIDVVIVNDDPDEVQQIGSDRIGFVQGDACDIPFDDGSFDVSHANSVIEHVGSFANMRAFAREMSRLAPAYYVQTPYFWFPVDPHFFRLPAVHWLPVPAQLALMRRHKIGHLEPAHDIDLAMEYVESRVLLDRTRFRALFPDAEHRFERVLGLPKSMIATRTG